MSRGSKIRRKHLDAATRARSGRSNHGSNQKALLNPTVIAVDSSGDGAEISDDEVCSWPGGVNNHLQVESDLKANLPLAMGSVKLTTIRLWEHRMVRWMAAYSSGLSARNAQKQVKDFSSRKYTSHRRVPETLARQFDS